MKSNSHRSNTHVTAQRYANVETKTQQKHERLDKQWRKTCVCHLLSVYIHESHISCISVRIGDRVMCLYIGPRRIVNFIIRPDTGFAGYLMKIRPDTTIFDSKLRQLTNHFQFCPRLWLACLTVRAALLRMFWVITQKYMLHYP